MSQKWEIFIAIIISLSLFNQTFAANEEVLDRAGKDHYVIAVSKNVIKQNPEVIKKINSALFIGKKSVKNFFLRNSYKQFDFGAAIFVVEQDYPNMFSVIADLDNSVDWTRAKGIFMINVDECEQIGGGGLLPQEFQTNDGMALLSGIILSKCTVLGEEIKPIIKHELAHTFNMFGHANLLDSSAFFKQEKYKGCTLPFNSSSPNVRTFNAEDHCPVVEYGDFLDTLGITGGDENVKIFSASRKELVGWLPKTLPTTRKIGNKGNYNLSLYPHDTIQTGNEYLVHVKIMKGRYGFYSIEFRASLVSYVDNNKVIIRYAFDEGGTTYLIASLSPGETYYNPTDKFSVKFKSESSKRKFKTANLKLILK